MRDEPFDIDLLDEVNSMGDKAKRRRTEYDLYKDPEYQKPQGPARRRKAKLTDMVPVRFPAELLAQVRQRAEADDRSVSSWIRRAVESELKRTRSR